MAEMKVTLTTKAGPFEGAVTAGALAAALYVLPTDAAVRILTYDNQMEGAGWSVEATWEERR